MSATLSEHLVELLRVISDSAVLVPDQPSVEHFGEGAVVECKTIGRLDGRGVNAIVAKNISSFANANGGILILGIDSRRERGENAEILTWELVENAVAVADRIAGSLHSLIEPAVPGIDIRPVLREDGAGLVLIVVPKFEGHPIVSVPENVHGFWVRMGSSTTRMLYRQVAERFVATPVPHATLNWLWESRETQMDRFRQGARHHHGTATVKLVLKNDSAASLKHLFVRLSISGVELVLEGERAWPPIDWRYLSPRLSVPARERGFSMNEPAGEPLESPRRTRTVRPDQGQSPLIYPGEEVVLFECRATTLPDGNGVHSLRIKAQVNADKMIQADATLALDYNELRDAIHNTYA